MIDQPTDPRGEAATETTQRRSLRRSAALVVRRSQLLYRVAPDQLDTPPYTLERTGVLMTPEPGNPLEVEGVLNPASARGADGHIYLFPRMVAEGNLSRVGRARVVMNGDRVPVAVERLGVALEPEHSWEKAGVEDPRISWLPRLSAWVMTYTAVGPVGPRIAMAISRDLLTWKKIGLLTFVSEPELGVDFNSYHNKDALIVPRPVLSPNGIWSYAIIHRPMWDMGWSRSNQNQGGALLPTGTTDEREAMWVSYAPAREVERDPRRLAISYDHQPLALPEFPWEEVKIGGGTPPVLTPDGWLILHHGISRRTPAFEGDRPFVYSAGAMILDRRNLTRITSRSAVALMTPDAELEQTGTVGHVVFPTAIEPRSNGSWTVFYGMADSKIGTAQLTRHAPK